MTDKRSTKILTRTFFNQMRAGGYTSNQIIEAATELLDLVTTDLREQVELPPPPGNEAPSDGERRQVA